MQVETFRYLMSALAQVYGALIFGVAVFLTFRYHQTSAAAQAIRRRLARLVVRTELWRHQWASTNPEAFEATVDSDCTVFEAADDVEIEQRAGDACKQLDGLVRKTVGADTSRWEMRSKAIQDAHARYKRVRTDLGGFVRGAKWLVAIPAVLCWLFSALLSGADLLQRTKTLSQAGAWSLVLAGCGLAYLVRAAGEMLRDVGSGTAG